jgi:hypothetical protein
MARYPVSLATEQLRARIGVIKGVIGPDQKEQPDPDEIKEARQLTNDVLRLLDETPHRQLKTEQAIAISAKTTASETLIIQRLPIGHLLSALRDSCMQILALTDRITGEYAAKERSFATETLKELSSRNTLNEEAIRRLYLQARQRLDSLLADRLMLMQAAHHFMSSLWLRTATAVLICSIPVVIFVYARYWHPISYSPKVTQQAEQAPQLTTPSPQENSPQENSPQENSPQGNEENLRPVARLATLFSVVIMGIAGAFVSNYSRVCALLKEAMPLGISSADRSIRIRFSPFVGGLLAIILSEVFGGHLVQGDLFPMTEQMHRWTDLIWSGQAYSKLLLWGFVAGLSENYVLRTLGSLAMRVGFGEKSQGSKQPAE